MIDNYLVENILQFNPADLRRIKQIYSGFRPKIWQHRPREANQVRTFDNRGIPEGRSARRLSRAI